MLEGNPIHGPVNAKDMRKKYWGRHKFLLTISILRRGDGEYMITVFNECIQLSEGSCHLKELLLITDILERTALKKFINPEKIKALYSHV